MERFYLLAIARQTVPLTLFLCLGMSGVASSEEPVSYNREIRHILSNNCFKCHGPDSRARKRRPQLDMRETATVAWTSGATPIVPGRPEDSEVIRRISSPNPAYRMPPADERPALSQDEIASLTRWIEEGAHYEPHWSYVAPLRPEDPQVHLKKWPRNSIDSFVLSRLEQEGLEPAPEADSYTLVRRVYLDLVGLPPTPAEVTRFVDDPDPKAYERLVDRLLASPRYGEHWAVMWLDLARYADTKGYEKDEPRTMWPYRDWVIRAFNDDMPYDRFTIEQLAGDLLPNPDKEQLFATAFHRNTMTNDEGGTDDEEFRVAAIVDRVNTTLQTWMGTTVGCAQCHHHKYDPIPQEEFYRLFAFFNQTADNDQPDEAPVFSLATEVQLSRLDLLNERIAEREQELRPLEERLEGEKLSSRKRKKLSKERGALEESLKAVREQRRGVEKGISGIPIMKELPPDEQRETYVHVRGNFMKKGDLVEAGTPAVFHPFRPAWPRNRLGLARWIVARDNPLTARVTVNRHWQQFFGMGLVRTSEEFGTQGELPSHPDLLDWLAVDFMDSGWSQKYLCKTIVMSATYRQSSVITPRSHEQDPYNRLLARGPRSRLGAESIRDAALSVSGLLSEKMYGPSVMPYQPEGVWKIVYSSRKWETSESEDRYRRGLYTYWRRTSPYPSMMAFDAVSREVCTVRRVRTNTPLQALVLLNDPVYVEAAKALGRRVAFADLEGVEAKAGYGFQLALSRPPEPEELVRLVALYEEELKSFRADKAATVAMATDIIGPLWRGDFGEVAAWSTVANALLNLDEFVTKR